MSEPKEPQVKDADVKEPAAPAAPQAPKPNLAPVVKVKKLDKKGRTEFTVKSPFLFTDDGKEYVTGNKVLLTKEQEKDFRERGLIH